MTEQSRGEDEGGQGLRDEEVTISKLEAARTQLETAIRLFFEETDVVSVHTLAAAAHTIIEDVNNIRHGSSMLTNLMKSLVPEHKRKEVHDKIHKDQNFFKHADKDPDAVLTFRKSATQVLILDAVIKYHEITGETSEGANTFMWWLRSTTPDLFRVPAPIRKESQRIVLAAGEVPRPAFFAACEQLPLPDFFGPDFHKKKNAAFAEMIAHAQRLATEARPELDKGHPSS